VFFCVQRDPIETTGDTKARQTKGKTRIRVTECYHLMKGDGINTYAKIKTIKFLKYASKNY
jgi:hypothetical protein